MIITKYHSRHASLMGIVTVCYTSVVGDEEYEDTQNIPLNVWNNFKEPYDVLTYLGMSTEEQLEMGLKGELK